MNIFKVRTDLSSSTDFGWSDKMDKYRGKVLRFQKIPKDFGYEWVYKTKDPSENGEKGKWWFKSDWLIPVNLFVEVSDDI